MKNSDKLLQFLVVGGAAASGLVLAFRLIRLFGVAGWQAGRVLRSANLPEEKVTTR